MANEITTISPEGLEVAASYLTLGNIKGVCEHLQVAEKTVVDILNRREVKKYIDTVYLDSGYRNKNNIASLLDEMIQSKLDEAQESGVYSSKDLADLLQMAHKMRMDEIKAQADLEKAEGSNIRNQTNVPKATKKPVEWILKSTDSQLGWEVGFCNPFQFMPNASFSNPMRPSI